METKSLLTPTQRYASGALFAIALNQVQIHQNHPLGLSLDEEPNNERTSSGSSSDSVSEDPELWVNENSGLLRPVFRILEIDSVAWSGLEQTAGSSPAKHHVGAFLRLLSESSDESTSQSSDHELALSKAVDAILLSMEQNNESSKPRKEKHHEYAQERREKCSIPEVQPNNESLDKYSDAQQEIGDIVMSAKVSLNGVECKADDIPSEEERIDNVMIAKVSVNGVECKADEIPAEEVSMLSHERKVTVLYELLSACLADIQEKKKTDALKRKGYDARYRVTLRLLASWFDVKWTTMEAIETMVACSAIALAKMEDSKQEAQSSESKWAKIKRGGIIGAAALTGGALLAITGGLAAPAIAAGLGALAPTLGTIIPVIGASGFAAAAGAAGTVAGSVAVAASFGAAGAGLTGTKMARRTGNVDEFEFKAIGENHKQGRLAVEILISGFAFDGEDFIRPWEGENDNLERYALQWESKNLIAVSTSIQDWLTSRLAMELMRQGAMLTVLSTLLAALAWPATLLTLTEFIDSKWTIAVNRSDKAGRLLAEVLMKGLHGNRPVTLVGFSLGARVIFQCLQTLAEKEQNGIVERVVLLGAPIPIKDESWETARKMVVGRFVNAYSTNDWTLGVAFRASLLTKGLAGIQPIDVPGIQNVDITDLIEGHSSYLWATQQILELIDLDNYYPVLRSSKGTP